MKFCPECGTAMNGATVCGCGYTVQTSVVTLESAREKFLELKKERALKRMGIAAAIIVPIWLLVLSTGEYGFLIFVMLFGAVVFGSVYFHSALTNAEYHSIPGTHDAHGEHVCVFCGGQGLYRKGVQNSSVVQARCTKCGTVLFHE